MACYHPLKAYYRLRDDGKKDLKFCNSQDPKPGHAYISGDKIYPYQVDIPCGQCIGCRLEYSRQWAIRIMLEAKNYAQNYFVTLTYDDEHLPVRCYHRVDSNTGEIDDELYSATLRKKDLSTFIKDLRAYFWYHYRHNGIRFYASGEYGSLNNRPHYHPIFFNLPIPDLKIAEKSPSGAFLYESDILSSIWKKGRVRIAELNFDTACYVARYVTKKHKGKDSDYYDKNGLDPEFSLMSRNPGIAYDFFVDDNYKMYDLDKLIIGTADGSPIVCKPVKYFDRLYDLEYPDKMLKVKNNRSYIAKQSMKNELSKTDLSKNLYLFVKENNKLKKVETLVREL